LSGSKGKTDGDTDRASHTRSSSLSGWSSPRSACGPPGWSPSWCCWPCR